MDYYSPLGSEVSKTVKCYSSSRPKSCWANKSTNKFLLETQNGELHYFTKQMKDFKKVGILKSGHISTVFFDDDESDAGCNNEIFICVSKGDVIVLSFGLSHSDTDPVPKMTKFVVFPGLFNTMDVKDFQILRTRSKGNENGGEIVEKYTEELTLVLKAFEDIKIEEDPITFLFEESKELAQKYQSQRDMIAEKSSMIRSELTPDSIPDLKKLSEETYPYGSNQYGKTYVDGVKKLFDEYQKGLETLRDEIEASNRQFQDGFKRAQEIYYRSKTVKYAMKRGQRNDNMEAVRKIRAECKNLRNSILDIVKYDENILRSESSIESAIAKVHGYITDFQTCLDKMQNEDKNVESIFETLSENQKSRFQQRYAKKQSKISNPIRKRRVHKWDLGPEIEIIQREKQMLEWKNEVLDKANDILVTFRETLSQASVIGVHDTLDNNIIVLTSEKLLHYNSVETPSKMLSVMAKDKSVKETPLPNVMGPARRITYGYDEHQVFPDFMICNNNKFSRLKYGKDGYYVVPLNLELNPSEHGNLVFYTCTHSSIIVVQERAVTEYKYVDNGVSNTWKGDPFWRLDEAKLGSSMVPITAAVSSQELGLFVYTSSNGRRIDRSRAESQMFDDAIKSDYKLAGLLARTYKNKREAVFRSVIDNIVETLLKKKDISLMYDNVLDILKSSDLNHSEIMLFLLNDKNLYEQLKKQKKEKKKMGNTEEKYDLVAMKWNMLKIMNNILILYTKWVMSKYHVKRGIQKELTALMALVFHMNTYARNQALSNIDDAEKEKYGYNKEDEDAAVKFLEKYKDVFKEVRDVGYYIARRYPVLDGEALIAHQCNDYEKLSSNDVLRYMTRQYPSEGEQSSGNEMDVAIRSIRNLVPIQMEIENGNQSQSEMRANLISVLTSRIMWHTLSSKLDAKQIIKALDNGRMKPSLVFMALLNYRYNSKGDGESAFLDYLKRMSQDDTDSANLHHSLLIELGKNQRAEKLASEHIDATLACYRSIGSFPLHAADILRNLHLHAIALDVCLGYENPCDAIKLAKTMPENTSVKTYLMRSASRQNHGFGDICSYVLRPTPNSSKRDLSYLSKLLHLAPLEFLETLNVRPDMRDIIEKSLMELDSQNNDYLWEISQHQANTTPDEVPKTRYCESKSHLDVCDYCGKTLMDEDFVIHPCGHSFHVSCSNKWIEDEGLVDVSQSCIICGEVAVMVMNKEITDPKESDYELIQISSD